MRLQLGNRTCSSDQTGFAASARRDLCLDYPRARWELDIIDCGAFNQCARWRRRAVQREQCFGVVFEQKQD